MGRWGDGEVVNSYELSPLQVWSKPVGHIAKISPRQERPLVPLSISTNK
jgi:hypothetical protein